MARWTSIGPTGELHASSSTATTGARELRKPHWKAHSGSSQPREAGTVDGYPIALPKGKKYSNSFIWGGTESMYVNLGFRPLGSFGASNRVMGMRKFVRGR